jgi:hypothetical protein
MAACLYVAARLRARTARHRATTSAGRAHRCSNHRRYPPIRTCTRRFFLPAHFCPRCQPHQYAGPSDAGPCLWHPVSVTEPGYTLVPMEEGIINCRSRCTGELSAHPTYGGACRLYPALPRSAPAQRMAAVPSVATTLAPCHRARPEKAGRFPCLWPWSSRLDARADHRPTRRGAHRRRRAAARSYALPAPSLIFAKLPAALTRSFPFEL